MKNRYTVRRSTLNKHYWAVFDRLENRVVREYPDVSKLSAYSLIKFLNQQISNSSTA